jgi:hypothetical protein
MDIWSYSKCQCVSPFYSMAWRCKDRAFFFYLIIFPSSISSPSLKCWSQTCVLLFRFSCLFFSCSYPIIVSVCFFWVAPPSLSREHNARKGEMEMEMEWQILRF